LAVVETLADLQGLSELLQFSTLRRLWVKAERSGAAASFFVKPANETGANSCVAYHNQKQTEHTTGAGALINYPCEGGFFGACTGGNASTPEVVLPNLYAYAPMDHPYGSQSYDYAASYFTDEYGVEEGSGF
tara:strand:- start:701 stop:1096 length:396 start_codon:yes stop_codon:yes gene_type:complete